MEILIRLDQSDLDLWNSLVKRLHDDYVTRVYEPTKDLESRLEIQNNTSKFWDMMQIKYPYIRNKRVALNLVDAYIFSWNTMSELAQYRK